LLTNKQISVEALRRNLILIENVFALWSMEIWAKVAEIGINWMVTCKKKIVRQDKFQTLKFKIILLRVETIFDCGSSPCSLFTPHPTCQHLCELKLG
jgi:hypothetical protein